MMISLLPLFSLLLLSLTPILAAPTLTIDAGKPTVNVSADLWGIFFEEINHAGVGGLYAERIQNSNFETMLNTYAPWAPVRSNPSAAPLTLSLSQEKPLTWQSPTSLRVDSKVTDGKMYNVAIENPGFWGISTVGQSSFTVTLWAASSTVSSLTVSLTNREGSTTYGQASVKGITSAWTKLSTTLSVTGSDSAAVFSLQWMTMTANDTIHFDVISVLPTEGWQGLPYIRADLAEHVAALKPAFVRFPGGCYVEGDSLTDRFNWKKALGPMEERRGHWNLWGYFSEDGLGLFEYLSFIEKLTDGFGNPTRTVWVVSSGDSHTSHVRPSELQPWVDEALQSIEFATGDVTSEWGRLRAEMGHPAPFHIDFIAIGNEGNFYEAQYKPNYAIIHAAISQAYPHIPLIANGYWDDVPVEWYDYHVYQTSGWFFDNQHTFDKYPRDVKIFNSEYAVTTGAGRGNLDAALGEATWMTGLERNSDVVRLASYAPLFVNENDQTWNPDAIVFNSSFSYGTPSYWTQVLFSNSFSGLVSGSVQSLSYELSDAQNISVAIAVGSLTAAECTRQGVAASSLAYVHKLINYRAVEQNVTISLTNIPSGGQLQPQLDVTILSTKGSSARDENSFTEPHLISPVSTTWHVSSSSFTVTLPKWSVVVARAIVERSAGQHARVLDA